MTEDAGRFFAFFRRKLNEISSLEGDSSTLFKKTLISNLIDALSKAAYPNLDNNWARYTKTIQRFGCWADGEKLSLPHLEQLLRIVPDPAFEKLRAKVFSDLGHWPVLSGEVIKIASDPGESEVRDLWPQESDHQKPLGNLNIKSFKHLNLLWVYRNSLVHELRSPGYGMEFDDDDSPFYHIVTGVGDGERNNKSKIELCYPTMFFYSLASKIIENMKVYFEKSDLNPYASFRFGTYWIDELNR